MGSWTWACRLGRVELACLALIMSSGLDVTLWRILPSEPKVPSPFATATIWIFQGKEQQFSQRAVPVKWECKIPAPRAAAGEGKLAPAPHGAFFFFLYI